MSKKLFRVKRYVIEIYQVEAENREDAIDVVCQEGDTCGIIVTKYTVKQEQKARNKNGG